MSFVDRGLGTDSLGELGEIFCFLDGFCFTTPEDVTFGILEEARRRSWGEDIWLARDCTFTNGADLTCCNTLDAPTAYAQVIGSEGNAV